MSEAPTGEQQDANFASKRMGYFVALARQYEDLLELHRDAGQLQKSEDYGVTERGHNKRWGDPTEHCLVEAAAVGILADMLQLSADDKDSLVQAAFVHDYRKKGEIEELQGVTDPAIVDAAFRKTKVGLTERGVSESVVSLTGAVAHTSLDQFVTLNNAGEMELKPDVPLANMAMHYIDDITKGVVLVPLDERIDKLEAVAETQYPYNEEGRAVWGGRTFFEAQREAGHLIENHLAAIAGVAEPTNLPNVIIQHLINDINSIGTEA